MIKSGMLETLNFLMSLHLYHTRLRPSTMTMLLLLINIEMQIILQFQLNKHVSWWLLFKYSGFHGGSYVVRARTEILTWHDAGKYYVIISYQKLRANSETQGGAQVCSSGWRQDSEVCSSSSDTSVSANHPEVSLFDPPNGLLGYLITKPTFDNLD